MPPADFLPANEVALVRGEPIPVPDAQEAAVAASWRTALERNPSLFNGPLVSPLSACVRSAPRRSITRPKSPLPRRPKSVLTPARAPTVATLAPRCRTR